MSGTISELTVDECLELLAQENVGRVAISTPIGVRIVPVNYSVYEDQVVFRTAPYSELGSYGDGAEVAFEIDNLDHDRREGWSVVAFGRAALVDDPDDIAEIKRFADPSPWATGTRSLYMRLAWNGVTGRRITAAD